jgi:hypothetical protein
MAKPALNRLLRLRELEEELSRQALEVAVAESRSLEIRMEGIEAGRRWSKPEERPSGLKSG